MKFLETINVLSHIPSDVSGHEFIQSLIKITSDAMGIHTVIVGKHPANDLSSIETIAVYSDGEFKEQMTYSLHDTPCSDVMSGNRICVFTDNIQQLYPRDILLQDMGMNAYVGSPLIIGGKSLGILVFLSPTPLVGDEFVVMNEYLACRVSSELVKIKAHDDLKKQNEVLEQLVQEKTESLTEALRLKNNLIATIFHDLSNPLAITHANLSIAESGAMPLEDAVKSALRSTNVMMNVVEGIRLLLQGEQLEKYFQPISPKGMMENFELIYGTALKEKEIDLISHFDDCLISVEPHSFFNSVCLNFLSNAIKFTPVGGTISVSSVRVDSRCVISFQDSGDGIPEDVIRNLREFRPSKASSTGNGFGLLIAKDYINRMSGSLKVCSTKTDPSIKGTLVQIEFPAFN